MLMVVGLSCLYVGSYGWGVTLLAVCLSIAAVFFRTYGPYLDRLEQRAPPRRTEVAVTSHSIPGMAEPLSTDLVVALALTAYGTLIMVGSLIWTRGEPLALNLLAGGAFFVVGIMVWLLGSSTITDA